jgi:sugar phosphate isomerase/epimerase
MLGVPNVNTMVGKDQYMPFMDSLVEFKKVWPDIVKHAEDSNVKIAIEFAPMYYSRDEWPSGKNLACAPRMWDEMFSIIDSKNFGLNYDPTHMVSQLMDYIRPVYDYAEKIFHFHIKDAKVYKERFDYVGILATPVNTTSPSCRAWETSTGAGRSRRFMI